MKYIGIDPGLKGAIVSIDSEDRTVKAYKMPSIDNYEEVKTILQELYVAPAKVIIERPILKPHIIMKPCPRCKNLSPVKVLQKGVMTSLINYGILLGTLISAGIPFEEVIPAKWKKYFKLEGDKKKSIRLAKELFPDAIDDINYHDGIAEAILISEYGRRNT